MARVDDRILHALAQSEANAGFFFHYVFFWDAEMLCFLPNLTGLMG